MSSSSPFYSNRIRELDHSITDTKHKLSQKESRLLTSHNSTTAYTTPHKMNTDRNDSSASNTLVTEKELEDFLNNSQRLRDILEEKAKFIELEYEKEALKWNDEKKKLKEEILMLNQKIDVKDEKIANLIESVANLKAELKRRTERCEEQQKLIGRLSEENKDYRAENTQVKRKNNSLSADNKIISRHLDKLLKSQNENQSQSAQQIFEEREKRVIESLYIRSMPAIESQDNPEMLPSERNELSNKVKLDNLMQEYKDYRRESNLSIRKLKEDNELKAMEIQSQNNRIRNLQSKLSSLQDLRQMEQAMHSERSLAMKKMEGKMENLQGYNQNLLKLLEAEEKFPRIKEQIGRIVTFKNKSLLEREDFLLNPTQ